MPDPDKVLDAEVDLGGCQEVRVCFHWKASWLRLFFLLALLLALQSKIRKRSWLPAVRSWLYAFLLAVYTVTFALHCQVLRAIAHGVAI